MLKFWYPRMQYIGKIWEKINIAVYVNDLLLVGKNINKINSIKHGLKKKFKMSDLGPYQHYLGIGAT